MFDDDLATMLADPIITVPASIGTSRTRGIFQMEDVFQNDPGGGIATTNRLVLTIRAGSLAGLPVPGDLPAKVNITIDGTSYRVRDVRHAAQHLIKVVVT